MSDLIGLVAVDTKGPSGRACRDLESKIRDLQVKFGPDVCSDSAEVIASFVLTYSLTFAQARVNGYTGDRCDRKVGDWSSTPAADSK